MSLAGLFDHQARIYRPTTVRDSMGGGRGTYAAVNAAPTFNNAKWTPDDHDTEPKGSGDETTKTGTLSMDPTTDLQRRDLVRLTGDDPESPVVVRVVSVTKPRGHHVKAKCEAHPQPVVLP